MQLALAYGVSYFPDYYSIKIVLDFHENSNIKKKDDKYYNLELDLQEAKIMSDVLRNVVNHLEERINLAKKGMLKDECYFNENEEGNEIFKN